ncbi:hypothetical protein GJ496_011742 [Pomphorhynchus laevis]|nr:hypothetical protein GJ496_011742 [Pomphorhynchus laevis]
MPSWRDASIAFGNLRKEVNFWNKHTNVDQRIMPVVLKRHNLQSKYAQQTELVDLILANPLHARVRFTQGNEGTVSTKHLAPYPIYNREHINEPTSAEYLQAEQYEGARPNINDDIKRSYRRYRFTISIHDQLL